MKIWGQCLKLLACASLLLTGNARADDKESPERQPNVVFVIIDDLNDYTGFLGGHPQTLTPNMDALAARSTSFTDAYPTLPICAPSRASLFTGIQPYRSRSLSFGKWFENDKLKHTNTMMEYFRLNGYRTLGVGKVLHHNVGYLWDEFHGKVDYGPIWYSNGEELSHPSVPKPFAEIGQIDGSFAPMTADGVIDQEGEPYTGWWSIPYKRPLHYRSDTDRDLLPDEISAQWAARRIKEMDEAGEDQPFFMAVGLLKPHTPLHVPNSYFDRIAAEGDIVIPNFDPSDVEDTYYRDVFDDETRGRLMFREIAKSYPTVEQGLQAFIRAYLANISFADDQVGTIMRAIEQSTFADNTIIVLTSDHGWTNGEKDVLFKNNLWKSGTRVPLLIHLPGQAAQTLHAPVSLIDIFPTLRELAGLTGDTRKSGRGLRLDGTSLVDYMNSGESAAPKAAIAMLKASNEIGEGSDEPADQHYSLITRDWRYIRYNTGQEELYHRASDPLERHNLAELSEFEGVKLELLETMRERLNPAANK